MPSNGVTVNPTPLQSLVIIDDIEGAGLIVTLTVKGVPVHVPSVAEVSGVTVYVAICTALVVFVRVPVIDADPLPAPPPVNPAPAGADQL